MSWNGEIPQKNKSRVKGLRNKRRQKSAKALAAKLMQQSMREAALASVYESSEPDYRGYEEKGRDRRRNRDDY